MRGFVNGVPIVDSKRVVVVYGARRLATYFFPTDDVRMDVLRPAETQSTPGERRMTLDLNGRTIEDIAWTYTDLAGEHAQLRDYIASSGAKLTPGTKRTTRCLSTRAIHTIVSTS